MSLKKKIVWTVVLGLLSVLSCIIITSILLKTFSLFNRIDEYYFIFKVSFEELLNDFNAQASSTINNNLAIVICLIGCVTLCVVKILDLWLPSKNFVQRSYEEYKLKKEERKQQCKQKKLDKKRQKIEKLQDELKKQE